MQRSSDGVSARKLGKQNGTEHPSLCFVLSSAYSAIIQVTRIHFAEALKRTKQGLEL